MKSISRPLIAITMGDPSGIGPELCLKMLCTPEINTLCIPVLFGSLDILYHVAQNVTLLHPDGNPYPRQDVLKMLEHLHVLSPSQTNHLTHLQECQLKTPRFMDETCSLREKADHDLTAIIINFTDLTAADFIPGEINASCGKAAFTWVKAAICAAIQKEVSALVTAPIQKEAFHLAGIPYPGHTEILADMCHNADHVMMLTSEEISCALVTAHMGYTDVPASITPKRVADTIRITAHAMQRIHQRRKIHLTICGLNPHAGEHGLFGCGEEENIITPAMKKILSEFPDQLSLTGPLPPDTAFIPRRRAETDAYICMTHDQGLIPLKMLAFDSAVNITLGLPIIRTSVDHGTALDISRQGTAHVRSLLEAIKLAVKLT